MYTLKVILSVHTRRCIRFFWIHTFRFYSDVPTVFCRRDHLVCTVWKICAHVSEPRASFAKSRHLQWHLEITWLPAPWLHRQPRWTLTGFKHWVVSMPSTSLLLRNFQKTRKRRETTTMMSRLHWSTWYCYWSTTSCSSTVVVPGSNTHCTTKIPVLVVSLHTAELYCILAKMYAHNHAG